MAILLSLLQIIILKENSTTNLPINWEENNDWLYSN
jgi:hypothetical protein